MAFELPVSRLAVELHPFTGVEDLLLLENVGNEMQVCIALADRLAYRCDAESLEPASLPLTDLETLLIGVRRTLFGDRVRTDMSCPIAACGAGTEISFRLSDYVAHYTLHPPRFPLVKKAPGWYGLPDSNAEFRLVTAGDLMAALDAANPTSELARRTVRPAGTSGRELRRVQRAMQSLCPSLSQDLQVRCPECGGLTRLFFNIRSHVLRELGYEATFLYQDVHLLAIRYHWSEEKILSLPRARRTRYAELASMSGSGS